MIPHTLHIVWIGDVMRRPAENIESWRRLNPGVALKEWGNAELEGRKWQTRVQMQQLVGRELSGVADLMRYEILLDEGGVAVDADSRCLRPLDEFIFEHDPFAVWESEIARPGLISCAFMGASRGNALFASVIRTIVAAKDLTRRLAWKETGPLRLTECVQKMQYADLTIFPSHFFIPRHYTGVAYGGQGRVYADHQWASTQMLLRGSG